MSDPRILTKGELDRIRYGNLKNHTDVQILIAHIDATSGASDGEVAIKLLDLMTEVLALHRNLPVTADGHRFVLGMNLYVRHPAVEGHPVVGCGPIAMKLDDERVLVGVRTAGG